MCKFSIIIPCYNEEKNIRRCLNSIFCQTLDKKNMKLLLSMMEVKIIVLI